MASRKNRPTSRPPPPPDPPHGAEEPPAIHKLYPEDIEQTGGALVRPLVRALSVPPPESRSSLAIPPDPPTVRSFDRADETGEMPSLAGDDEIPNLAPGEDGTSTDQTALMADLSVRSGSRATLSVLSGLSAGQVITLEGGAVTLGRGKEATAVLRDPGVSRLHVSITRTAKGVFELTDLGSTNGVRINGVCVATYALRPGDRVQLGPQLVLQFAYLDDAEEALTKQLYEAATRDPLTQALNRRAFDERLVAEFAHARRHRTLLSLVLCDIDHFKRINDKYGHPTGDRVLRALAREVLRTIRAEDVFARYGGEEFVVLVRGDSLEQTRKLAERIRNAVGSAEFRDDDGALFRVTLSAGLAAFHELDGVAPPGALVSLADQRMYRAKHAGRDRTCSE